MKLEAGLHDVADFSPIAPGKYEFVVKEPAEVVPEVADKTDIGTKMYRINVKCEIVGGENAGKKLTRRFTNKSKATRYFLKTFLEKVGVKVEAGNFNTEDLLGRRFSAIVGERAYTDQEGNEKKAADLDVESVVAI